MNINALSMPFRDSATEEQRKRQDKEKNNPHNQLALFTETLNLLNLATRWQYGTTLHVSPIIVEGNYSYKFRVRLRNAANIPASLSKKLKKSTTKNQQNTHTLLTVPSIFLGRFPMTPAGRSKWILKGAEWGWGKAWHNELRLSSGQSRELRGLKAPGGPMGTPVESLCRPVRIRSPAEF